MMVALNSPETSSSTTTTAKKSKSKADEDFVEADRAPEWLPEGWVMELKNAAGTRTTTKMVKLFVAPTGHKFYSKPQVLRHLQTSSSKHQSTHDNSNQNADLPPGWLSEFKTKGGRRDWYFTDPVSGFIFRSRKDVFRYLETGDVNKCATRPKISTNNAENDSRRASSKTDTPTTQFKKTRHSSSIPPLVTEEATTKQRFTRGSAKPQHVLSPANKTPLAANKGKGRLELRNLMSPNSIEGDTSTRRVTRGYYSKQVSNKDHVASNKEETPNSDGASVKIGSAKTNNGIDIELNGVDPPNSTMKRFTRGSSKTNGTDKDDSPNFKDASIKRVTRGSVKTNGIDIEVGVNNFDPICSVVSPVKDSKRKHGKMVDADTAQYTSSPVKDPNTQNGAKERITRKNQPNTEDLKKQQEMNATRRSSRRHATIASKPPLVNINSEAQKQTPPAIAREENVDAIAALNMIVDSVAQWASQQLASIPELARKSSSVVVPGDINNVDTSDKSTSIPYENQTDPKLFGCLEKHMEKLSSGNQTQSEKNGNQESQPKFVFGDSWADPCLEFAYKTLTSDLPMENNQNYFQPQPYTPMVIDDGLVLRIPKNTFDSTITTSDAPVTPVFGQRSQAFIPSIDVNKPFNPQESSFDERNKKHN